MESFPLFFRTRAITFTCIMMFSFLWIVLLCVEMFTRWSISDHISQSLMILFILTNTTTLIMLPILILVPFRIWLDTARLLLLFVLQLGSAVAGSIWSPKIQCPDQTPDDLGVCELIGVYTMIACWIIPTILTLYSTYFAVVVYLQSRIPVVVESKLYKCRSGVDLESGSADSLSSWNEKIKEVFRAHGSNTDVNVPPRPLVLPTLVHARQLSLPQPHQSTLPNAPRHQSMISSLPHTSQQPHYALPSVPSRHLSLPAFKHGNGPHLRPLLTLTVPRPPATNVSSSHPQTPSSCSYPTSSPTKPQNQIFGSELSIAALQSPRDYRGSHPSPMMPSSSSDGSFTTRTTRARLSKPLPAHLIM